MIVTKLSSQQRQIYQHQGYLVVRSAFGRDEIEGLTKAIDQLIERALQGKLQMKWRDREARVPKKDHGFLHPTKYHDVFGSWLEAYILPSVEFLLEAPIRYSDLGMLFSGNGRSYKLGWHRDTVEGRSDELDALLQDVMRFCSIQAPLKVHDDFLQLVPGTHNRLLTDSELSASRNPQVPVPGEQIISLEPGDILFRHPKILHRGYNLEGRDRRTFIGSFCRAELPLTSGELAQKSALRAPGHLERMPPLTRIIIQHLLDAR